MEQRPQDYEEYSLSTLAQKPVALDIVVIDPITGTLELFFPKTNLHISIGVWKRGDMRRLLKWKSESRPSIESIQLEI